MSTFSRLLKSPYCVLVLIACGVGVLVSVWRRGDFTSGLLVYSAVLWIGIPALSLGLLGWLFSKRFQTPVIHSPAQSCFQQPLFKKLIHALFGVALFLFIQVAFTGLGFYLNQVDTQEAKQFCEQVDRLIERYQQRTGQMPASLKDISATPLAPPRLIDATHGYQLSNGQFYCNFANPAGMMDLYFYDSNKNTWHRD